MTTPRPVEAPLPADVAGGRVLVADDDPETLAMMERLLTSRGFAVTTACDGADALTAFRASEFDLVITDIAMPQQDGIAVLKQVKQVAPDVEVIVVTALSEMAIAVECLRAGAFDLVCKPFHTDQLASTVQRALEHRQLRASASLYRACRAMFAVEADRPLAERMADVAREILGADDVSVMLPDATGGLYVAYASGLDEATWATIRVPLGERVAGRVARDREPLLLSGSVTEDPRFNGVDSHQRVHSSIVYPLAIGDRLLGVISLNRVASERAYRETDFELAGILAAQMTFALANETLVQQLVSAERLAAMGLVAAGVAHEINNPLTCVITSLDVVREELDQIEGAASGTGIEERIRGAIALCREAMGDAVDGSMRIADIVQDMNGLSRGDREGSVSFDPGEAIRSAVRLAGPYLRRCAVVEVEVEAAADVRVEGNPGKICQVMINLLTNAAHAIRETGRGRGRIRVSSRRDANAVVLAVADDGVGMAPAQLTRIMQPFFTTKGPDAGTGLGLSISQEIVRRHRGELRVQSCVGVGTTFQVVLPGPGSNGSATAT